jgi:hypothetical protein
MASLWFEKLEITAFNGVRSSVSDPLRGTRSSFIHTDVFRLSVSHQCRLFERVAIPSTLRAIRCSFLRQPIEGY